MTMDKGRASEMTQTNIQTDRKSRQRYKRERDRQAAGEIGGKGWHEKTEK